MLLSKFLRGYEARNALWLIFGRVVQMGISFVVGVLTARYLGPDNFGLINYGNAYVIFFVAICNLGLNAVIIKDFVDNPNEQGEAIGSALVMRFFSSIFSIIMIWFIVSFLDKNEIFTIMVVMLCSCGSVFNIFETFNYWFQNQYKSKVTSIATLCAYVITSGYKVILLLLEKDVRWFAFATSIDYIVVAIFLWFAYKKNNGPKLSFSIKKSKNLLNMSYNYILSSILVAFYGQTDRIMLKQLVGINEVGYYSVAITICTTWTFVLQAIIDSMYPSILRLKNESQYLYEKKNRQLYAIVFYSSCFVSLVLVIIGRYLVTNVFGCSYLPSVAVIQVATWYTAFSYLGVARNAWIVTECTQRYLKYIYGCAVVFNVIFNLVMIPLLGAMGAALASLITQVLTGMLLPLLFKEMRPNVKLIFEAIALRGVF